MDKKLRALIDCRNLWAWLAITGHNLKVDYTPAKRYPFECPCCWAAGAIRPSLGFDIYETRDCSKCLLNGYAWTYTNTTCPCENAHDSLYDLWCCSGYGKEMAYYAMRMVQACDQAIEAWILKH